MLWKWWTPLKLWPFLGITLDFCTCTCTMVTNVGYPETTHPPLPAFSMTSSQFVNFSSTGPTFRKVQRYKLFPSELPSFITPNHPIIFDIPDIQKTRNLRGEYPSGMIFFHIKQKKNKFASTLDPQFCTSFSASELGVPAADTQRCAEISARLSMFE